LSLTLEYFCSLRNLPFGRKVSNSIELLSIFQISRLWLRFQGTEYPNWAKAQLAILSKSKFLYDPRAFLGIEKQFQVKNFIRSKNRRLAQNPKPKRFIGVGYRDKGTAAIPSYDNTPSWQEIASNFNPVQSFESMGVTRDKETPFRILTG
jgi:hypothetical protein